MGGALPSDAGTGREAAARPRDIARGRRGACGAREAEAEYGLEALRDEPQECARGREAEFVCARVCDQALPSAETVEQTEKEEEHTRAKKHALVL